jgi:putative transposase
MGTKRVVMKAFEFRVYPNKEQQVLMEKTFGSCRFVFNHYLYLWNET